MSQPRRAMSHLGEDEQRQLQVVMNRRRKELEIRGGGPTQLSGALREVLARRKIGRVLESRELGQLWRESVPEDIAAKTRVLNLRHRQFLVEVADTVLLSELANFHQRGILKKLQQARPDLQIQGIKWKLNLGLKKPQ